MRLSPLLYRVGLPVLILVGGMLLAARGLGWPLALAGLLAMLGFVFRAAAELRWMPDLFRPAFWIAAAYTVVFGLGGARLLIADPTRHLELWLWILVGFGALVGGLRAGPLSTQADALPPRRGLDRRRARRVRRLLFLWLIMGLGAALTYISKGGGLAWFADAPESARVDLAEQGGAVWHVLMLGLIPWCWWATLDRRTGKILPTWFFIVGAVLTLLALVATGNRAPLVMLLAVSAMIHLAWPGRLDRIGGRFWVKALGLGLCAGLLFGTWGGARLLLDSRTVRYPELAAKTETGDWIGLAASQTLGYIGRGAENLAVVLDAVPESVPYRFGATYLQPLATIRPGVQRTLDMQLKEALDLRFAGGGFVPSMLGEAYINFGYFGFVLVPFLIGLLLTWLYARWRSGGGATTGLVYCLVLYYLCVHMVSGIQASSVLLPWCVALLLLTGWLMREVKRG